MIASKVATGDGRSKGAVPAIISKSTAPMAQTSLRASTLGAPRACSGER